MKKYLFLLLLPFGIYSCHVAPKVLQDVKVGKHTMQVMNLNDVKDTVTLPLSEIVESVSYIKFDNDSSALFGNAWGANLSDNYIGVVSRNRTPYKLFDKKGNFIRNVGIYGRGPGEYMSLYQAQIAEKDNRLYLTPFASNRILEYDLQGNFLGTLTISNGNRKSKSYIRDSTIVTLWMPFQGDQYAVTVQTKSGKLLQGVPNRFGGARNFDNEIFSDGNIAGTPDYFYTAVDTLFHYDEKANELIPVFHIQRSKDLPLACVITELPRHYLIWVNNYKAHVSNYILANKKSGEACFVRFINDSFGDISVQNVFTQGYYNENISAFRLKQKIEKALENKDLAPEKRKKLEEFNANLQEDENNILFYGKLKQ